MTAAAPLPRLTVGRYALYDEVASGGMATVHYGRMLGQAGFSRIVAIKRMHAHCAKDPDFLAMFVDEARIASRIRHPNVVPILDVVAMEGELLIVMEYVHGESLARLARTAKSAGQRLPIAVVGAILVHVLEGLHAAHEALSESGRPLEIVHRDVSPQNVMVGHDGVSRVLDFGVALAAGRMQTTREGQVKGKLAYMSPEQIRSGPVDRRTDVYAASVLMWEALTGGRLFDADNEPALYHRVLDGETQAPSLVVNELPAALDAVVMRGLERDPERRFQTATEMAFAIEEAVRVATPREVAACVNTFASSSLSVRAARVAEIESVSMVVAPPALSAQPSAAQPSTAEEQSSTSALVSSARMQLRRSRGTPWYRSALLFGGILAAAAGVFLAGAWVARSAGPSQPTVSGAPSAAHPAASAEPTAATHPAEAASQQPPPVASLAASGSPQASAPAGTSKGRVRPTAPAGKPPSPVKPAYDPFAHQ